MASTVYFHCRCTSGNVFFLFCVVFFWFCPVVRYLEPVCSVSSISLFPINAMLFLAFAVWLLLPGLVHIMCWVALRGQFVTPNCSLFLVRDSVGMLWLEPEQKPCRLLGAPSQSLSSMSILRYGNPPCSRLQRSHVKGQDLEWVLYQ